ncbi:MAG TPA: glycosyltransferase family 2 protein [Cyclobacteriaceae bacterium]|nr:glycosyltransferase family 2 protein [Cyclobacteriaceae bacterium]
MLSDDALVTVIMPAYNAERYIENAIRSILNQTYENIELLVGIDGCTDRTIQVVKSFDDSRLRVFEWRKNLGNVYTCNRLFQSSNGAFIAIQDADDWSAADRIRHQIGFLQRNTDVGLVGTGAFRTDPSGRILNVVSYPEDDSAIQQYLQSGKEPCFVCASVMVKTQVYHEIGGYRIFFNGIGAADYDWVYRISEKYRLANIAQPLYYNRRHLTSFTKSFNKNPLKRISPVIAFDFYKQRLTYGYDFLSTHLEKDLQAYLLEHTRTYRKNPSLVYTEHANYLYGSKMYGSAVKYTFKGILKNPFSRANYMNLVHYIKKAMENE